MSGRLCFIGCRVSFNRFTLYPRSKIYVARRTMAAAFQPSSELNVTQTTPDSCANQLSISEQQNNHKTTESTVEQLTAPTADSEASVESETVLPFTTSVVPEGVTKKQWKKQLRLQRKMIMWDRSKQLKKAKSAARREQRKREKELAQKEGWPWPPKRKLPNPDKAPPVKKFKKMSSSDASPIRVAIDFGLEHLMTDKDIKMLVKQCQRCYSQNRRAAAPLQLYWTNFGGRSKERLDAVMSYKNWDVHMRSHGYIEEFGKENVVYLTSDSSHILTDLDPSKAYIIGGLVDHNHHKGYCLKHAVEQDIAHAQLPISEFVKLNCRAVLAINHVFEILLAFSQNNDWKTSFYQVIPPRKVANSDSKGDVEVVPEQSIDNSEELNIQVFAAHSQTAQCDSYRQCDGEEILNPNSPVQTQVETKESDELGSENLLRHL